jgi:CheY-like chemotaxis protein
MTSLGGIAVLIVEDDPDTLELYASSLAKLGATVRRANSAEVAIALLGTWRPDVVLCDLHLPGVDGYALLDRVHADPALCPIPMVAVSASHPDVESARALRAGFTEHLAKPVRLREIVAGLKRAVELA